MNNYNEVINNYKVWYEDLKDKNTFEKKRKDFISQHKNFGLKRVQIEPTQRCNYSCHMCPIDELNPKDAKKDLEFSNFCKIIDQLPKTVTNICLSGLGEPFLNKEYINMAKYSKERGYTTEIYNNGSFFDEKILEYTDYIFFSVDGLTKELLSQLRSGVKYDKLFESIRKSVEYKKIRNINVCINFTISNQNYKEIPLLFKFCEDFKIDYLYIQAISNNYSINSEKREDLSNFLKTNRFSNWKYIIDNYNKDYNFNLTIWYPRKTKGFCHWTFSSLYINKNQEIISCCQRVTNPTIFGTLKNQNIEEIYNSKKMIEFRAMHEKNEDISLCNNCPY